MSSAWTGWIGFAAIMLAFIGAITFFEGLIAIIRDNYYVVTRQQVFAFDVSTWGWIMLFWGILLFLAGLGLAAALLQQRPGQERGESGSRTPTDSSEASSTNGTALMAYQTTPQR
jgi:hypothetical protein